VFGLPIVFYILQLILQFTYFNQDSVKFLLLQGKVEEASIEIERVYEAAVDEDAAREIAVKLTKTIQKTTNKVPLFELFNRTNRGGTGVALIIMAFHELTAMGPILLYSNTIISDMGSGDSEINGRLGTYLVGVFNFLAASCALYSGKAFSRRFLFLGGHGSMFVTQTLMGVFVLIDKPIWSLICIFIFLFCYQNTSGAITWLYCSEIAVDSALGIVGTSGYVGTFVLALTV